MTPSAVRLVAAWATDPRRAKLGPATIEAAKATVLDLVGAAAGGRDVPAARAVRDYARSAFAPGVGSIWFTADRLDPAAATLANSAAGAALDVDDGHRRASGHPGSAIVPAAIAIAERESSTGADVLAAITVGYEVAVRAGSALRLTRTDTISTGHWCAVGVAAAAGRLAGLSETQLASAMGTALAFAPRLVALGSEAHDVKEGIPWAAHAGIAAVELARSGFQGPLSGFEDGSFDRDVVLEGLGVDSPLIESVYFKPYACCRWAHAPIDAALDLMLTHAIDLSEIEAITVDTFERTTTLFNSANPATLEAAQYSVPFCVAAAITLGGDALLPIQAAILGTPSIVSLAERVHLRIDPELDAMFPAKVPARVTIRTRNAAVTRFVDEPLGEPTNPLGWDGLVSKFDRLTADALAPDLRERAVAAIANIESASSIHPLATLLRGDQVPAVTR